MFNVIEKTTGNVVQVYKIQTNASGYPMFLIYQGDAWIWKSAKHFRPPMYSFELKNQQIVNQNNYDTLLKFDGILSAQFDENYANKCTVVENL